MGNDQNIRLVDLTLESGLVKSCAKICNQGIKTFGDLFWGP